ncbi:hypothetical protein MHY85_07330 [Cellulomonas sp. ACRRI]|uniref:hypothetical protein n=1 Tax=Cellulomonas sp. ACRRI TaxID=2918188 RepID=UPI001EF39A3B|nr:hypothetical protein [Cellulomonas sp. ACRRI]MCG7285783.1 hypothetical protein [Cellulomonas sp. ACRRI]
MTRPHDPPVRVFRRRLPAGAVLGGLLLGLTGCSGPSYDPDMEGIPEARAAARVALDDAVERIRFSDRVTVLGEGRADACGTEMGDGVFADPVGYHCSMGWMVALVVPEARTRDDVAGAVDAELASMDVTTTSFLASSLVMAYPSVRDGTHLRAGGHVGEVDLVVEQTPFRAASWLTPRIPRGSAEVSSEGDLGTVDASAVRATGADEVVTVLLSTTYWDTTGRYGVDRSSGDPTPGPWVEHYAEGAGYRFDIALPDPVGGAETCAQDGAVDPATVRSAASPFPRVTFALRPEAVDADMQRVRGCLTTALAAGAVAVLTPGDPSE